MTIGANLLIGFSFAGGFAVGSFVTLVTGWSLFLRKGAGR
jgi:hypothetical protein